MIRLRPSGVDEILIKRVRDWYEPGPGVFFTGVTGTASFSPAMLFTGSTTGVWYDPSDMTTLFQDAAGTTPVTAVEQPVGRMLDRSGRGNHAFNSSGNSANFPVLSARYNLLTKTEQFDDAVWPTYSATTVSNQTTAPNGTDTADAIFETSATGSHGTYYALSSLIAGVLYKASFYIKPNGRTWILVNLYAGGVSNADYGLYFNLSGSGSTGSRFGSQGSVVGSISAAENGFYLVSITTSAVATGSSPNISISTATGDTVNSFPGDPAKGIYIWGADLRVANDALNQPAYQRVNTSSDYDTVGFKQGEVFDGINDYLTASAGGGSTASFFWCSAIRVGKVGAAQTLFSDAGTNTGYRVRINASNQLELSAGNGTAYTTVATTATLSIGQRAVLTTWHDGTSLNVQINNGTVHQAAFSTATAGTAQFTIGKDNNAASNFFAGWLYEKVYTKDNVPSSAQIADTKAYVANIAGITL